MARKAMVITGVAVGVAAVVVGGGLFAAAVLIEGQTVEGFARAPVGCTTTLEFDTADTFTLYLETKGTTDDLGGDCASSAKRYSRTDPTPPAVELVLVDSSDAPVTLGAANDFEYDTVDFVGTSFATVDIAAAGTYQLTVTSDADDIAIAVGRDPSADSAIYLAAGLTIGGIGVLVAVGLIVFGAVAKPSAPSTPSAPVGGAPMPGQPVWAPTGAVPGYTAAPPWTPTPPPPAPAPPSSPLLPPGSPLPPPPAPPSA